MPYSLSWDLLIIVFFVIIMSYSYIVGQNGTIKIILSSYIGMLSANGIGNLLSKYVQLSQPLIKLFDASKEENTVIFKILVFVAITLILVLRGSFSVDIGHHRSWFVRLGILTTFGFLSAGLIMSTILVFIASASGQGFLGAVADPSQLPLHTVFVKSLIQYYNAWFAAPAVAFIAFSYLQDEAPPPLVQQE